MWHGEELKPEIQGTTATLSFDIEAHGYGAVLAIRPEPDEALQHAARTCMKLSQTTLAAIFPTSGKSCRNRWSTIAPTPGVPVRRRQAWCGSRAANLTSRCPAS